jgi:hypothetical protein
MEVCVNRLIQYLLENIMLDFKGELTLEGVREMLREDESREAKALLTRIVEERGVDDLLVTLADCLKEHIGQGITPEKVKEQLSMYSEA